MAAETDTTKEIQVHSTTYSGFIRMMKWGTIIALLVALLVMVLISR